MPRKRLFCQENDTRSGRRFACHLYPSHGPLRCITSHSFRARLCHAKNEAPEEEAVPNPHVMQMTRNCISRLDQEIGTLRSETRRLQDATGSKFSKRRHVAHAQSVVLVSPRRVENVGFACLTFCTKREYICSCA